MLKDLFSDINMNEIIEKYHLIKDSILVYNEKPINGKVDCWFDAGNIRQHRCLTIEDFNQIPNEYTIP